MKKLLALLAVTGLAGAGAMFAPAMAADDACLSSGTDAAAGVVDACGGFDENGGHGKIDGNDANEGPHAGYIAGGNDGTYETEGLCISDQGDPEKELDEDGNDTNPDDNGACNEDIPEGVVAYATGS